MSISDVYSTIKIYVCIKYATKYWYQPVIMIRVDFIRHLFMIQEAMSFFKTPQNKYSSCLHLDCPNLSCVKMKLLGYQSVLWFIISNYIVKRSADLIFPFGNFRNFTLGMLILMFTSWRNVRIKDVVKNCHIVVFQNARIFVNFM